MKAQTVSLLIVLASICLSAPHSLVAQTDSEETFWKPNPRNYEVNQAIEIESLFPMYLYGGWHIGVGYRYEKFRFRVSVINGGEYNADSQSANGEIEGYERYYTTSPGFFFGYNVWKNLELYGYYERHAFDIKQLSSNEMGEIVSNDFGIGLSYQFFIGKTFYIQPGVHTYFRPEESITFNNGGHYTIPTFELTPIIRVGARLWKKHD